MSFRSKHVDDDVEADGAPPEQQELKVELPPEKKIKSHARRLEGLQAQIDELREQMRAAWESAKDNGVNKRMLKQALKHKASDAAKVKADREHYALYSAVLGIDEKIAKLDSESGVTTH